MICSLYVNQEAFDWGTVERHNLAKCLMALCRQVRDILKEEPRLLKLKSPTYILGTNVHPLYPVYPLCGFIMIVSLLLDSVAAIYVDIYITTSGKS